MKVVLTARARADLAEIHDYIALDSPQYAARVSAQLLVKSYELGQFPKIGQVIAKFSNPNLRERHHRNYRIAYRIKDTVIEILSIRHVARLSED